MSLACIKHHLTGPGPGRRTPSLPLSLSPSLPLLLHNRCRLLKAAGRISSPHLAPELAPSPALHLSPLGKETHPQAGREAPGQPCHTPVCRQAGGGRAGQKTASFIDFTNKLFWSWVSEFPLPRPFPFLLSLILASSPSCARPLLSHPSRSCHLAPLSPISPAQSPSLQMRSP